MSAPAVTDYGPTHLLAFSDSARTLCGQKAATTYPHMLARFVTAHRAGHERSGRPFVLCTDCETQALAQGIGFGELR